MVTELAQLEGLLPPTTEVHSSNLVAVIGQHNNQSANCRKQTLHSNRNMKA